MSPQVFHIRTISVTAMPGFKSGLNIHSGFSPQLNIITGPNASGKSSLARALQKVIWQESGRDYNLRASAIAGADDWRFELNAGYSGTQKNGYPATLTGLPTEGKSRYLLALHELVKVEDADLAEEIHRQLSGGYDLDAAARVAGFNDNTGSTNLNQYRDLRSANDRVKNVSAQQQEVQRQQENLAKLKTELQEKKALLQHESLYHQTVEYRETSDEEQGARLQLLQFPEVMQHLTVQDLEDVESCESDISDADLEIKKAEATIAGLRKEIETLGLPAGGIMPAQLDKLIHLVSELEERNRHLQQNKEKLIAAQHKLKNATSRLPLELPEDAWKGLQFSALVPLENEWTAYFEKCTRLKNIESQLEIAKEEKERIAHAEDRDTLVHGIRILTNWLQEQNSGSTARRPKWPVVLLTGLAIAGGFLSFLLNSIWIAAIVSVVAVVVLIMFWKSTPNNMEYQVADNYKRDFEKLQLPINIVWTPKGVAQGIDQLNSQLAQAARFDLLSTHYVELERSKTAVGKTVQEFRNKLNALREQLQFNSVSNNAENLSEIYWLLVNAAHWQEAKKEYDAAEAVVDHVESEIATLFNALNEILKELSIAEAPDFATAKIVVERLEKSERKRRDAEITIATETRLKVEKSAACKKVHQKIDGIFNRLKIEGRDIHQLRQLHDQLKEYNSARDRYRQLQHQKSRIEEALHHHPLYEKINLTDLTTDALKERIAGLGKVKSRCDELHNEIGRVEGLVDQYKRSHDLESALKDQDAAYEGLEALFEEKLEKYSGFVVANVLRSARSTQHQSQLYTEADKLFRKITRQRFSLLMPEGEDKAFRARDEVKKIGLSLDELSTGTRIQLLLAVRLAYIETQEQQYKLPLFADELLANSDEVRAQAIIEALVELSKSGRQVFYFTAQDDEVNKWHQYLQGQPKVDFRKISLEGAEGKPIDFIPMTNGSTSVNAVPELGSMSHSEYGKKLQVPQFNLLLHEPSNLHLWYLIDDTVLLHQLLSSQIRYWGQLKQLEKNPPEFAGENWPEVFEQIRKRAVLTAQLQKLFQIGRAKPITFQDVIDSGAVSPAFQEEVRNLLEELSGDPQKLLLALENKTVSGFRTNKITELQEYFESKQLLPNGQEALTEEQLLDELYAFAAGIHLNAQEVLLLKGRLLSSSKVGIQS